MDRFGRMARILLFWGVLAMSLSSCMIVHPIMHGGGHGHHHAHGGEHHGDDD